MSVFKKNVSGQFIYFGMVSSISGNVVTGIASSISGRKSLDAGTQALLSGSIAEIGGGQYVAKLFDFDTNGDNIGFLFTASGCSPVNYTMVTDGATSGRVWLSSGQSVAVNSGQNVLIYSGQLSGQPISLLSGQVVILASGQLSGQLVNLLSGNQVGVWSGTQVNLFSGQNVLIYSGQLSGQQVSSLDLLTIYRGTVQSSTAGTTVLDNNASSQAYAYTGHMIYITGGLGVGQTRLIRGYDPITKEAGISPNWSITPDNTSTFAIVPHYGPVVDGGFNGAANVWLVADYGIGSHVGNNFTNFFDNNGVDVNIPIGTLGNIAISGVPVSLLSGQKTLPYSGQLSGQQVTALSVLDKSGYAVSSGDVFLASGSLVGLQSGIISNAIPDAVLSRDFTALSGMIASGMSGRNLLAAARKLTNKWDLTATSGYLSVYQEDDTTVAMQQAVSSVSGAIPVTGLDTR